MSKKILVTGGAGFVGSHLSKLLLDQGHRVTSLDNFQTGSAENHLAYIKHPRFELVRHDIVEPFDMEVDEIYNLACPASPPAYQASPIKTLQTSLLGVMNVLDLASRRGARVLQASTSEVYGDPTVHPQPESYFGNANSFGERSCYDEGKRAGEALLYAYKQEAGVEVRIARIFNTYGPQMQPDDGRVVSNFIVQALQNQPITIYGDGLQTRSFCFVSDLVAGLHALMHSELSVPVNLGNPGEFTMRELAELVIELTGSSSKLVERPLPPDDPKLRRPDITRAQTGLGWSPKIALREGLVPTIAYFDSMLSRKRPHAAPTSAELLALPVQMANGDAAKPAPRHIGGEVVDMGAHRALAEAGGRSD
jgi:UDP-glucuronate decarboxylase